MIDRHGRSCRPATPFFTRPMLQRGSMVDGRWRPPKYGPYECGNPVRFSAFEVPAERLCQALQGTRAKQEAAFRELFACPASSSGKPRSRRLGGP